MIIIDRPYCGKEFVLGPDEIKKIIRHGEIILCCSACKRKYLVYQGLEEYEITGISDDCI